MCSLVLSEIDACIAQSQVHEIVLEGRVDVVFALYVVSCGLLNQERIGKEIYVVLDGIVGNGRLFLAPEGVGQLVWAGKCADVGGYDVDKFFQIVIFPYVVSVFYVFDIGLVEQCFQESDLLFFRVVH